MSLGDQVLSFSTDKLLLKGHQSGALWLLHLCPCDLICDLGPVVSAWLDTLLSVANSLEDRPRLVQVVRILVLLLANLAQENANLVGEVRDGLISGLLTPFRELGSNGDALLACGLIGADQVVLGLDELEEALSKVWLGSTTQRGECEPAAVGRVRLLPLVFGAN